MKCRTDFELYCLLVSSYSNLKEPFQPQHFNKSQSWDLAYVWFTKKKKKKQGKNKNIKKNDFYLY